MLQNLAVRASGAMLVATAGAVFAALPAEAGPRAGAAAQPDDVGIASLSSCVVPLDGCHTAAVPRSPAGKVSWVVHAGALGCRYRVKDVITGRVVSSGRYFFTGVGVVGGLTNWYRLELHSCSPGNHGVISGG
jgi:hypothetical protein